MTKMRAEAIEPIRSLNSEASCSPVILLVEDESIVREVTREVLVHAGYSVLECATPVQALEVAARYPGPIDLLLTDVVMPGMNGADLAIRLQSLQPDMVTVFMSGYAQKDVMQKIKGSSAIHIQKPFTIDGLLSQIGKVLEKEACVG